MNKTTRIIMKREFLVTVKRKTFIVMTLFFPLLMILPSLISFFLVRSIEKQELKKMGDRIIVVVDETGNFREFEGSKSEEYEKNLEENPDYQLYPSVKITDFESANQDLLSGKIDDFYVIPKDFLEEGMVEFRSKKVSMANTLSELHNFLESWIRWDMLDGSLPEDTVNRVVEGIWIKRLIMEKGGLIEESGEMAYFLRRFLVPYGFAILFPMIILSATGYLVQGVAEEKQNKVVEVLISTVTAEELFAGKLLGLGGAAILQGISWFGTVAIILAFASFGMGIITTKAVITGTLFFLTGYFLIGSLMLALGSLGSTPAESQAWSFLVSGLAIFALATGPIFSHQPNGLIMRAISWFPITAPVAMNFRVAFGDPPLWDIGLAFLLNLFTVYLTTIFGARIWKSSILMKGMPLSMNSLRTLWKIVINKD